MSEDEEISLSGASGGRWTASAAPGQVLTFGWKRGAPLQELVPVDERQIYSKLGERQDARRAKDFDLADDIMHELTQLGVGFLDDGEMTWFAVAPPEAEPREKGHDALPWGPDNNLGKRKGDWSCPNCGANVFASKMECYRCSTPRPGGGGGVAGDADDDPVSWPSASRADPSSRSTRSDPISRSTRFSRFVRRQGDTADVNSEAVTAVLEEREEARGMRDFDTADRLRHHLQAAFGVVVDDEEREWWVAKQPENRVARQPQSTPRPLQNTGPRTRPGASFSRMPGCRAQVDEEQVKALLQEREEARRR